MTVPQTERLTRRTRRSGDEIDPKGDYPPLPSAHAETFAFQVGDAVVLTAASREMAWRNDPSLSMTLLDVMVGEVLSQHRHYPDGGPTLDRYRVRFTVPGGGEADRIARGPNFSRTWVMSDGDMVHRTYNFTPPPKPWGPSDDLSTFGDPPAKGTRRKANRP